VDWWIYIEMTLSLVVALFWPVLLELSDFCQLATGCIYLWILWNWTVLATLLLRFHYSFQF